MNRLGYCHLLIVKYSWPLVIKKVGGCSIVTFFFDKNDQCRHGGRHDWRRNG